MPAVNLLKLRVELNDLLWNFTDPPEFRKTLLDLLEKFAYTAYRSESRARAVSTRPQLQVSLILLREMDLMLIPAIRDCIIKVDVEAGRMDVHLLPGLIEERRKKS